MWKLPPSLLPYRSHRPHRPHTVHTVHTPQNLTDAIGNINPVAAGIAAAQSMAAAAAAGYMAQVCVCVCAPQSPLAGHALDRTQRSGKGFCDAVTVELGRRFVCVCVSNRKLSWCVVCDSDPWEGFRDYLFHGSGNLFHGSGNFYRVDR
jgi:hypothetical protein